MIPTKRYGLPYMGSKNLIAQFIVDALPRVRTFYDVFAGGCAVTHAALLSGKYERVVANDISDAPSLFVDAIAGKLTPESHPEWISREDFAARKDTDPYVRLCWSFGNSGQCYLYGRDIEAYKKAFHNVCYAPTVYERKLAVRTLMAELWKTGLLLCNYYGAVSEKMIEKVRALKDEIAGRDLQSLNRLVQLQSLESLESLERLQRLAGVDAAPLTITQGDYRDVLIADSDAIIYCDPPYKDCVGYKSMRPNGDGLDYEEFYSWCERQAVPVFISEYEMPSDRFAVLCEKQKVVKMCVTDNRTYKQERVYYPRTQEELVQDALAQKHGQLELAI